MKRMILYGLILAAAFLVPVKRLDVAVLEPVQTVWLSKVPGGYRLETDTEDVGVGKTVSQALRDLEESCTGVIYLDTAQNLLVSENAQDAIAALRQYLKKSVRLCQWDGEGKLAEAGRYMNARNLGIRLDQWTQGTELKKLGIFEKALDKRGKNW